MLRRRKGWIGIDIGSRCVKVAQVERAAAGELRLRQAAVVPRHTRWPGGDAAMGTLPAESGQEILAALSYGAHFSGSRAACTLPMHLYGFRGLHIPQGSPAERRSMIASALHDAWDECNDPCEVDFWETDVPGAKLRQDEPNVNVLAITCRWAHQVTRDAAAANLQLQVLDGPPLAIARAVQLATSGHPTSVAAAVDWGFTSTTFCVVQGGRTLFTRRFRSCSLRLVCQSIESSLGVSLEEAQHLLLSSGLPSGATDSANHPLETALASAAAEHLDRLAEEIRRTLAYFHAQRRELLPERIWLLGGGACVRNSAAWLSKACAAPVHEWQLPGLGQHANGGEKPSPAKALADQPLLATAIALSALPLAEGAPE